jgi:hypothetical protein
LFAVLSIPATTVVMTATSLAAVVTQTEKPSDVAEVARRIGVCGRRQSHRCAWRSAWRRAADQNWWRSRTHIRMVANDFGWAGSAVSQQLVKIGENAFFDVIWYCAAMSHGPFGSSSESTFGSLDQALIAPLMPGARKEEQSKRHQQS